MPLSRLSSPFLSGKNTVSMHMVQVMLALIPGIAALIYFFGYGVLVNLVLAISVALLTESLLLWLRHRPIKPFLLDGSAVVTAMLLAIALPPTAPWWLTTLGIVFALVFAKHLYGGLGYNPFNPAMVAYVLLLVSFPLEMTTWMPVLTLSQHSMDLTAALQAIFHPAGHQLDMLSGATPLDTMKTELGRHQASDVIMQQSLFSAIAGKGWEWVNIWLAIGGLFLLYRRVISWHIPVAMLSALSLFSLITWWVAPELTASPLFHLLSGGTMLGAFFIATDPVTAATTVKGRLIFGAGIGVLIYIIRIWGGYPDGVAFAVLIMNMLVPLIDYYTPPTAYGADKS